MRILLAIMAALSLAGCYATNSQLYNFDAPVVGEKTDTRKVKLVAPERLQKWWKNFNDPTLNKLIEKALKESPTRRLAEARVRASRGVRVEARSALFPQIGISGTRGRQRSPAIAGIGGTDDFFDLGFDVSYELDVFGRLRNRRNAADEQLNASIQRYHDVSVTLASEVARVYTEYLSLEQQRAIMESNLRIQNDTLKLIQNQRAVGEAPQLDVERSEGLVNTTKARAVDLERLSKNAVLQLAALTGQFPSEINSPANTELPDPDVRALLLTQSDIFRYRPDIRAAVANLRAQTALAEATIAEIYPQFNVASFYGIAERALGSSGNAWAAAINIATPLLNFGRIQGRIDTARADELEAFEVYRRTVLDAVAEVQMNLNDHGKTVEKLRAERLASKNAENALAYSQILFKEGEISFIDVLDAQRTVNNAQASVVQTRANALTSLIALYKSFGVY